jgi:hydroxymethylpyrimidine pyrophosphatase-like HAD family hydrolase
MTIAVDFDGTVVGYDFPNIGKDIGAVPILKKIVEKGHKLILLTMRSGDLLEPAVKWFADNGIKLYDINRNKSQFMWTKSQKVHADLYIDDQALGAPLIYEEEGKRPHIDWEFVENYLTINKII